jgi:hypothetical protein
MKCTSRDRDGNHECMLEAGHIERHNSGRLKWDDPMLTHIMATYEHMSRDELLATLRLAMALLVEATDEHCCAGSSGCIGREMDPRAWELLYGSH